MPCGYVRFGYIICRMVGHEFIHPLEPLARGALRQRIVQQLLRAIVKGELSAGTRLVANRLATRFGVSATPIREALVELQQSGIVELLHNRGAVVRPFGPPELRDYYAVRRLLESEAVRLACGQVDHELLSLLRFDLERIARQTGDEEKWCDEFLAIDQRIHAMGTENCGNKRLIAEIDRFNILGIAMRDLLGFRRSDHQDSIGSLLDLLTAMLRHQSDTAAAAMGRHIDVVGRLVEAAMFDRGENGKST
jgi:DNA-binding GntR family transcriptional regulator